MKSSAILQKAPTGISGLDEVTFGGLPRGRTSLICGSAGCGKTVFALEFIVNGILTYNEPGVFIAFEENAEDLAKNVSSFGIELNQLCKQKKLIVDYVHIERSEIQETGEFDLEGLFIRLQNSIEAIGAKRIAIDTLEAIFSGFSDPVIIRAELRRLFRWLKDRKITALITGEKGEGTLTRQGLEEYVSDCVILLDHRVVDQVSTRRLRVVKYRGSSHGMNEYPFLIGEEGISVLPISSLGLTHSARKDRVSTGIFGLDEMLEGKGFFRGSSVLISGTAGTGKTSLTVHCAVASCKRKEKCLYLAFEESTAQIQRNMLSIGLDVGACLKSSFLEFHPVRPTLQGLELHFLTMLKLINKYQPMMVIVDPITSLLPVGSRREIEAVFVRLIDFLKMHEITAVMTSLITPNAPLEQSEIGISSLIDTLIVLEDVKCDRKHENFIRIVKSRGMAHMREDRRLCFTNDGLQIGDWSSEECNPTSLLRKK